jgi:uncharacterized protein
LMAMSYDPITQRLVVNRKGLVAIEHYLTVRYFMYLQVYNHPKNLASRFILSKIYDRARVLLKTGMIEADPIITAWLTQDPQTLTCEEYLAADDIVFTYHLHRWRESGDRILVDLCRRYLDRDIFKTRDISDQCESDRTATLAEWKVKLEIQGFDPEYYCGIRVALTKGYTIYQQGIEIQTTQGLRDIVELSPLVQTLSQPIQRAWLVHPR